MLYKIGLTSIKGFTNIEDEKVDFCKLRLSYITKLLNIASVLNINVSPFCIAPIDSAACSYVESLDGIILTGGDLNIHPSVYSDINNGKSSGCNKVKNIDSSGRIEFEIDLIKRFIKAGKPVLGICLGMEILNISLGGTLEPIDCPTKYNFFEKSPNKITKEKTLFVLQNGCKVYEKQQKQSNICKKVNHFKKSTYADAVSIFHNTYMIVDEISQRAINKVNLNNIAKVKKVIKTNSAHSYRVHNVGKNLLPFCFTGDGGVEGIIHKEHPFAIGVQWHPELTKAIPDFDNNSKYDPFYRFLLTLKQQR
ncbi:MAG: gamma-glutamyl-gamma-aminobutyrate hydrolase family protein [Alphaproteobacteria bacterium]|nr:gamma-glutamyl-gamma-aminobutyrate hydrolase family protein [Rickettsiales bacterium]